MLANLLNSVIFFSIITHNLETEEMKLKYVIMKYTIHILITVTLLKTKQSAQNSKRSLRSMETPNTSKQTSKLGWQCAREEGHMFSKNTEDTPSQNKAHN